jgi:ribosome assembly protein RRB1
LFIYFRKSKKTKSQVTPFTDNNKNLEEDEELEFDNRAYEMLHRANFEWFFCNDRPFLSFDFITDTKDHLKMDSYPYNLYFVSGT